MTTPANMSVAELDAALRAAMDDDWDAGGSSSAVTMTASVSSTGQPQAPPMPSGPHGVPSVDDASALDAALRAAMDSDWDGGDRRAVQQLAAATMPALPAGGGRHAASMGYLPLEGSAAAALTPGAPDPSGSEAAAAQYILPSLDVGSFVMPTLTDDMQREQMEEIQRTLANAGQGPGGSHPA